MKTTFAILIAALGLISSAVAGPSIPGGFTPPLKRAVPTVQGCAMNKIESVNSHGRASGPVIVTRSVNCTGQSCCAAKAACCATKKH